ncbi:MAG: phage tail tube protein [Patescibacteria group bacterium]
MSKGIGRLFQVGIARETTRGTAISSAAYWIPFSELALEEKDTKVVDDMSYGVIEDTQGQSIIKQWAEGKLKAPIGDRHFPLILYSVLGSLSTGANADASGNVKDHTITVGQTAQHQSLTYFLDDPLASADYKHANGVATSLEINYEMGKFLEYSLNIKAQKGVSTTNTPSTTAENRFLPQHVTFKLASSYSGLGAASAQIIKSLSLKFDNNIEDDYVLGSVAPADFLNKQFMIEGTLEAMWQNESDFKTFVLAGTSKAMRIDIVNSDVTIGTSANPEIKIDLAKVVFEAVTRPIKVNDMVKQTLNFKAHYSQTDTKMVQIVATNLITSY